MSKLAEVPIETFLLAQHAAPLECLICEHENCRSTERCRHCSAPMALAHQSESSRVRPKQIAVIGATGAGKTVYLGMLMDMLNRQTDWMKTTMRGPHSITLQQTTTTALSSGGFPEKTDSNPEHWNWVHCQCRCRRRRRPLDIVLPDISGEALVAEAERSGRYPAIRSLLTNCAGILVVVDAQQLQAGDHSEDFVAMKLLSLLAQLREDNRSRHRSRRERRPLALVFTKADACDTCKDDPEEFAEAHASALLRDCTSRFPNTKTFATSVAGACAYREGYSGRQHVPLRVEPYNIIEPFGWLLTQI